MAEKILYVVIHGLVTLAEYSDHFDGIIIDMDDHRMAAGHWLTEEIIPRGLSLQLTGVDTKGRAGLDGAKNLVMQAAALNQNALKKLRYADVTLPKPRTTYTFWSGDAAGKIQGTTQLSSTKFSQTQVLEYAVPGQFGSVSLVGKGFAWRCLGGTTLENGDEVSVLHIVNEPEGPVGDGHTTEEFLRSAQIYGADLSLTGPVPFPGDETRAGFPEGLLTDELVPLAARGPFVLRLISQFRTKPQLPPAPAIGTSEVCGPVHGIVH